MVFNLFVFILLLLLFLLLLLISSDGVINCDGDASGRVLLRLGNGRVCFVVVVRVGLLLPFTIHSLHPVIGLRGWVASI